MTKIYLLCHYLLSNDISKESWCHVQENTRIDKVSEGIIITIPKVDLLLQIQGLKDFVKSLPLLQSVTSFPQIWKAVKSNLKKRNKSHFKIINWQLIKTKINHYLPSYFIKWY
jgi:hypothetical protein